MALKNPSPSTRFAALTGFRGLCILWVVFSHLPMHFHPLIENFKSHWGIGVDFFLAISGFLVTRSLLQSAQRAKSSPRPMVNATREFLVNRVSRILPSYYLLLGLIGVLALTVDHSLYSRLAAISDLLPSFPLFYSNYTVSTSQDSIPALLQITWSIAFQEQFYLLLLAVFLIARNQQRLKIGILVLGLLSLFARLVMVFSVWNKGNHAALLQMWLPLRFDAIAWSCLAWMYYAELGVLWSTPSRRKITDALLLASLLLILGAHSLFEGDMAQAIIYCFKGPVLALIVRSICVEEHRGWGNSRILKSATLANIGLAAFEIYLFNAPIMAFAHKLTRLPAPLAALLAFAASVALGLSVYRFFGKPAQSYLKGILGTRRRPETKTEMATSRASVLPCA